MSEEKVLTSEETEKILDHVIECVIKTPLCVQDVLKIVTAASELSQVGVSAHAILDSHLQR